MGAEKKKKSKFLKRISPFTEVGVDNLCRPNEVATRF